MITLRKALAPGIPSPKKEEGAPKGVDDVTACADLLVEGVSEVSDRCELSLRPDAARVLRKWRRAPRPRGEATPLRAQRLRRPAPARWQAPRRQLRLPAIHRCPKLSFPGRWLSGGLRFCMMPSCELRCFTRSTLLRPLTATRGRWQPSTADLVTCAVKVRVSPGRWVIERLRAVPRGGRGRLSRSRRCFRWRHCLA